MRWAAYAGLGTIAFVGLHTVLIALYHPVVAAADGAPPRMLARAAAVPGEATVLFAGDTAAVDAALPTLRERGFEYPFGATVDLVRGADVAVVNIEAPISDTTQAFPVYKQYAYCAPARAMDALKWAGFDVLQLANNHATDCLDQGLLETIAGAERQGMVVIGAGRDVAEARRGVVVTVGDVRIGLLAYLERQVLWSAWVDEYARPGHPGVAAAVERDLAVDIARLRPLVDVLVVSFHMGDNYAPPQPVTLRFSRRAVELGADLVVNHHPHVMHPVMIYRGRPIVLSLGNYAFGTPGHAELDYGLLAQARIVGRRLARVELVPLAVQNRRVQFQPQPLDGAELEHALETLRDESARRGATLRIEGGRAVVDVPS
jgi:poly-gamma-glutamate synthesis protein (capsule biosynthesis protein)